jgi:FtsP/CotA-like multicopper oxidase with cupredoxin domain
MFAVNRRRFLAGAGAALALPRVALAAGRRLEAVGRVIEVMGKPATVFGISDGGSGQGLSLAKGERFQVELFNRLKKETLVHWHGLTPPSSQDGVPMLSQAPLKPGESFVYDFENTRTGTHWMHSHVGLQEQRLLAAPLIVRDPEEARADEQEHVVMLHDFTFRDPDEILAELKAGGGAHAEHSGMDHSSMGAGAMPAMLNDIVYDAYLANDRTLADPEIVRAEQGGRLRLRIINGAAASNMWIDLGELEGELIAVDGNPVEPVKGSMFPLAVAQRADVRIALPKQGRAWPVLFRPEGVAAQTGLVIATPKAFVAKLGGNADRPAPALDLAFEASLRAAAPLKLSEGLRSEMLHLGGGGADYIWTLNGKSGMHDTVLAVRPGERMEVGIMNMTSMAHPMHLHGHHFQIVGLKGQRISGAMRDTILVPPMETVVIAFDADNPGTWAFHCHHIYHMNSGMMGAMAYISAA